MGTEESNKFGRPCKSAVRPAPQEETPNRGLVPHWTSSMQAYYNSGSTPTPYLNPHAAGPYMYGGYMWPNQPTSSLLQCDALHYPNKLPYNPHLAEGAALAFSQMVHRTFGEGNQDFMKRGVRNSQPERVITKESAENGNVASTSKNDRDGMSLRAVNGSKESPDEGRDDTNNSFPSTKKQQSDMIVGHENSTVPTLDLKASDSNPQLRMMEGDDIKKERKRHSNRESAKRSRMRKQQECDELHKSVDTLKDENSLLTQRLMRLSEECLELSTENDSIEEELVKMHGPESIADLLPMKPT